MSDQRTTAEIQADIAQQREQLAETVDQLARKLDVKTQAKQRASELAARATTDTGKPRPDVVAAGVSLLLVLAALVWWRRR